MAARDSVLVTGAYGLVGRPVVERLVSDGFQVVATAHRAVKPPLPAAVDVRSVDLTNQLRSTRLSPRYRHRPSFIWRRSSRHIATPSAALPGR